MAKCIAKGSIEKDSFIEDAFKIHLKACLKDVSPKLEKVEEAFQKLLILKEPKLSLKEAIQKTVSSEWFRRISHFKIMDFQPGRLPQEMHIKIASYPCLVKLSSLFYGMRCIFAHGSAEQTFEKTLDKVDDFSTEDFEGNDGERALALFKGMMKKLKKYHKEESGYAPAYREFQICCHIYSILGGVISEAVGMMARGMNESASLDTSCLFNDNEY